MKTYKVMLVDDEGQVAGSWSVGVALQTEIIDLFEREGGEADGIDSFVELDGRSNLSDLGVAIAHFIKVREGVI